MKDIVTNAILTILGSGFGAGVVTFGLNYWKAYQDFRRAKIEELYGVVYKYTEACSDISLRVQTGQTIADIGTPQLENFARIDLLINLYFPQLLPIFERFQETMHVCILREDGLYRTGEPGFKKDFLRLLAEGNKLKAEVVELARQNEFLQHH